jgi:4-hydroxy-tetrahydrodipicolinate synthase
MTASQYLRGVIIPLTTPFDRSGEIDEAAFVAQLRWMVDQQVAGVVVGGSTGEGFALAEDELLRLAALAIETVGADVPVVASIVTDSTRAAVRRAQALSRLPLAALQIAPPHYIFSPSERGLVDFYKAVGDAAGLPVIVYNVIPWANISARLAADILRVAPAVMAVKQSDKNFESYAELVRHIGAEHVFAAIDGGLMSCYDLGARGSIAAIASAAPRASVALWTAVAERRREEAQLLHRRLLGLWHTLAGADLPARVKVAQTLQGLPETHPRSPMLMPDTAERARIAEALATLDA